MFESRVPKRFPVVPLSIFDSWGGVGVTSGPFLLLCDLWNTDGMKTAHLEILSEANDTVLKGQCSVCQNVTFSLPHNTESALALIHGMFSEHSKRSTPAKM
jgi:hypothetical protein